MGLSKGRGVDDQQVEARDCEERGLYKGKKQINDGAKKERGETTTKLHDLVPRSDL